MIEAFQSGRLDDPCPKTTVRRAFSFASGSVLKFQEQASGRSTSHLDISVIVATKNRSCEVTELLRCLRRQVHKPNRVFVVATCDGDFDPAEIARPAIFETQAWVTKPAGLTWQRNQGLARLAPAHLTERSIVVFFDDDFRPADDWIEQCAAMFIADPEARAMTGRILADGAQRNPVSEADARSYLDGSIAPGKHWADGEGREIRSVYGCNMAFLGSVFLDCTFDEKLPLYGWQEDRDITGQVARLGRVLFNPACQGVHLGASGGRTSGLRFGYSQVANLVYLYRKGTVDWDVTLRFLVRAFSSNTLHAARSHNRLMYFARLKGNLLALSDLARGVCAPMRILDLP